MRVTTAGALSGADQRLRRLTISLAAITLLAVIGFCGVAEAYTDSQIKTSFEKLAEHDGVRQVRMTTTNLGPGPIGTEHSKADCDPITLFCFGPYLQYPESWADAERYWMAMYFYIYDESKGFRSRIDQPQNFEAFPNCVAENVPKGTLREDDNGNYVKVPPGPTKAFRCFMGAGYGTYLREGQSSSVDISVPVPELGGVNVISAYPEVFVEQYDAGWNMFGRSFKLSNFVCKGTYNYFRRFKLRLTVNGRDNGCDAQFKLKSLKLGQKKLKLPGPLTKKVKPNEIWEKTLSLSKPVIKKLRAAFRKNPKLAAKLTFAIRMDGPGGVKTLTRTIKVK